jgi:archaellum component FlaF (FlaF/FlaG flagellin family)
MYSVIRRREIIKNTIYTIFILFLAVISTHYIYYKFQGTRSIDFSSESLDVTYHESTGNKLTISKVTPVTDSVGLSSNAYLISIKNNLTEKVNYKIRILMDKDTIEEDECEEYLIPEEDIRISVKVNKENKIYDLVELEDGILLEDTIDALKKNSIAIRLWVNQDSTLPRGAFLHYHGIIQVEEDSSIAIIDEGEDDD